MLGEVVLTKAHPFVGRKKELIRLHAIYATPQGTLVVIRGRRRIGKSRLIIESSKEHHLIRFSGLPPEKNITAQTQREHFAIQLQQQLHGAKLAADDWSNLLHHLATQNYAKPTIILLDEISWMAKDDPTFLPKLKTVWDEHFSEHPQLTLILCGSVSSWIDKNILNSTGFLGRVSEKITLDELSLKEANQLMSLRGIQCSALDKLMALAITGGVPRYIELLQPGTSILNNIKRLCFHPDGMLANEFQQLFHDLFERKFEIFQRIVTSIVDRRLTQLEIALATKYSNSAQLGQYLNDLETAGFIAKDQTWNIKTGKAKQKAQYRIKDNYLRFYLKYIRPQLDKITKGDFLSATADIPNFSAIMGLQFENLVLNNRELIIKALGLTRNEIVFDNPYFQKAGKHQLGCQIDYLIQTNTNTLLVCEIKFSKRDIPTSIKTEVTEKINRLKIPKQFTCVPVLIHITGMSESLEDSGYFYKTINFSDYL